MNKRIIVISMIIVGIISASLAYLLAQPNERQSGTPNASTEIAESTSSTGSSAQPAQQDNRGVYIDYSPAAFMDARGTRLLFFYAPWCPQCRALETDIKQKGVPTDVTILKVDYDSNQSLRQKYGVTIQTTVVRVTEDGNLAEKFVAYDDPSLSSVVVNLLQP